MIDPQAYAVHKNGVLQITVIGMLRDSRHVAAVTDKYPGGHIAYIIDPGCAQVFVTEALRSGAEVCAMALVPWVGHVSIRDSSHDTVALFVNGVQVAKTAVRGEASEYRVITLNAEVCRRTGIGYSVIPADAPYLPIYSSVFGPASKAVCDAWYVEHCGGH